MVNLPLFMLFFVDLIYILLYNLNIFGGNYFMYRIGICDDEILSAKFIAKLLESQIIEKNFDAEITIVTDKQNIIYDAILKKEIDILLLDIDFKNSNKNGVEFARELRHLDKNFYLVYVTAHLKYINLAFDNKTFDYIQKPVNKQVMERLVNRLIEEFENDNPLYVHINRNLSLKYSSIIYIEKVINSCSIHTINGVYTATITIDKLLGKLPKNFVKPHRSFIVNKDKISTIDNKKNLIIFEDNSSCPINSQFNIKEDE
jgi:two-component system, LytTR family, response regulator AgrA